MRVGGELDADQLVAKQAHSSMQLDRRGSDFREAAGKVLRQTVGQPKRAAIVDPDVAEECAGRGCLLPYHPRRELRAKPVKYFPHKASKSRLRKPIPKRLVAQPPALLIVQRPQDVRD